LTHHYLYLYVFEAKSEIGILRTTGTKQILGLRFEIKYQTCRCTYKGFFFQRLYIIVKLATLHSVCEEYMVVRFQEAKILVILVKKNW